MTSAQDDVQQAIAFVTAARMKLDEGDKDILADTIVDWLKQASVNEEAGVIGALACLAWSMLHSYDLKMATLFDVIESNRKAGVDVGWREMQLILEFTPIDHVSNFGTRAARAK